MSNRCDYYTNSDNKSLINICRGIVGGASLPRLFPLNAQNAENEIALCVSDRNATFLFRNGIISTLEGWGKKVSAGFVNPAGAGRVAGAEWALIEM